MKIVRESIDRFFDYDVNVESRTIYIGAEDVGFSMAEHAIKGLHLLQTMSPEKEIFILLNTFGGCWFNGMAIYDAIIACPCHVTITVIGSAMSMGSIILQAADTRLIHPNATLMVHDGYETRVDDIPTSFQRWAEYSKVSQKRMYEIFASKTGKPLGYWRKKCSADTILTAKEALSIGLVDNII